MEFDGFDWDEGNWPKCARHGVSKEEIEAVFLDGGTVIFPDPVHSSAEVRNFAVGTSPLNGHAMVTVFTLRQVGELTLVRPVSARYMHDKEARKYEQTRSKQG